MLGLLFGLITLTWVFSGLLSMEPYAWNSARGLALSGTELQGGSIDLQEFAALADGHGQLNRGANNAAIKEIEFKRLQGNYYYQLTVSAETSQWGFAQRLLRATDFQPATSLFSTDYVTAQLQLAVTDYQLVATDVLTEYDNYYYSRPSADGPGAPLPALRVKYDDPAQTWFYVDLNTSELVYQSHRWGRVERWLYHGLHSLDFGFFYGSRPLWDIVVIVLLTGGLLLCALGCYLGFKRLARNTKQLF